MNVLILQKLALARDCKTSVEKQAREIGLGESWGMANTFLSRPINTKKIIFMS